MFFRKFVIVCFLCGGGSSTNELEQIRVVLDEEVEVDVFEEGMKGRVTRMHVYGAGHDFDEFVHGCYLLDEVI